MTRDRREFLENTSLLNEGGVLAANLTAGVTAGAAAAMEPPKASGLERRPPSLALTQGSVQYRTLEGNGVRGGIDTREATVLTGGWNGFGDLATLGAKHQAVVHSEDR